MKKITVFLIIVLFLSVCGCKAEDNEVAVPGIVDNPENVTDLPQNQPGLEKEEVADTQDNIDEQPKKEEPTAKQEQPELQQTPDSDNPNETVYERLNRIYKDSEIKAKDDIYEVVSENIGLENVTEKSPLIQGSVIIEESDAHYLDTVNLLTNAIFLGKKTGETKQYIPISKETGLVDGLFYTESLIKVKKVYYGDVTEGDVISLREFYAVFGENKDVMVYPEGAEPIGSGEQIFFVEKNLDGKSLFDHDYYYYSTASLRSISVTEFDQNTKAETLNAHEKLKYELYCKFYVNSDTALDKQKETEKIQKLIKKLETNQVEKEILDALEKERLEKFDSHIQKYGEKGE